MNVIKHFITTNAMNWSEKEKKDQSSMAGAIVHYIDSQNKLRDAQVEALKVYLWLKCVANNKSLIEIFDKFYEANENTTLRTLLVKIATEINSEQLKRHAGTATGGEIREFFVELFGGYENVPNFLFSLPMGAGKTFVMASMIYIDLYFNLNNSDKRFAKNFLIFAPSGLKSSVIPSLRSIESFDPTWILPPDVARQIKQNLKFIVLDINKTAKKSNRIENPNARKVQDCLTQATPSGYVFVTNAEKVILDRIVEDPYKGMLLFEVKGDEKSKQENELRHLLAKVPNLSILIDEVHHNQKEENKLRLVINNQFNKGNLVSINGFTGTPYFKRKVLFKTTNITLDQIPNTIYHYELKNGIRNFLKHPKITKFTSDTKTIVRASLEDFYNKQYKQEYKDGRKPKLAIYCANIEKLEEEVLPIVLEFYIQKKLDTNEILKYYGSNTMSKSGKKYTLDKDAEIEFSKLDTPYSKKRIVLLCQIGKEGWDCQSLSGVVLSGEGDSPKNMVLQTSCRCLREVDDATAEIGLIYLNQDNYKHLEKELLDNHKITVKEFEAGKADDILLKRVDRRAFLKLPSLEYNQFVVEHECSAKLSTIQPSSTLSMLITNLKQKEKEYFIPEISTVTEGFVVNDASNTTTKILQHTTGHLSLSEFHVMILKSSLGALAIEDLQSQEALVKEIHSLITRSNILLSSYQLQSILSAIFNAFIPQTTVTVRETIQRNAVSWLIADINKNPISPQARIYPDNIDFINKVEEYDKKKINIESLTTQEDEKILQLENTKQTMSGDIAFAKAIDIKIDEAIRSKLPIKNKDRSFHYMPYEFTASKFEQDILEHIFQLDAFQNNQLEVYFNGDRFLSSFKIKIYKKINSQWQLIQDKYTPDFLIIKRGKGKKIIKTLIIETKGAHLAHDFGSIREFMQSKFLDMNRQRFDFLYLEDGQEMSYHSQLISDKLKQYFSN